MATEKSVSRIKKPFYDDKNAFLGIVNLNNYSQHFPHKPKPSCWHYSKADEKTCSKCNKLPVQESSEEYVIGASKEGYWEDSEAQDLFWNVRTGIMRKRSKNNYASIQEIKSSLSFEDIATYYKIEFKKISNYYSFSCPSKDHEDKNPSAVYWSGIDHFKCYSCGVYGDILSIIALLEGE